MMKTRLFSPYSKQDIDTVNPQRCKATPLTAIVAILGIGLMAYTHEIIAQEISDIKPHELATPEEIEKAKMSRRMRQNSGVAQSRPLPPIELDANYGDTEIRLHYNTNNSSTQLEMPNQETLE